MSRGGTRACAIAWAPTFAQVTLERQASKQPSVRCFLCIMGTGAGHGCKRVALLARLLLGPLLRSLLGHQPGTLWNQHRPWTSQGVHNVVKCVLSCRCSCKQLHSPALIFFDRGGGFQLREGFTAMAPSLFDETRGTTLSHGFEAASTRSKL